MKKKNAPVTQKHSQWGDVWRRLCRNKLAMVGMFIVFALVIVAVFAPLLAPYDPTAIDVLNRLAEPSLAHPMGTDNFGRDTLSRVIYGARISLGVSVLALIGSTLAGIIIGGVSGFFGGAVDTVIMRITDILLAVPPILMSVTINAALGAGVIPTAFAIGFSGTPSVVRMMRGQVLTVRRQDYIEAAGVTGSTKARIIFRHVIPNTLAPMIVDTSMRIGGNILGISGLSFIGLGVQPPLSEWGAIMTAGQEFIRTYWPLATFPGLAIALTLFGFNVFGDGLRDALDPKLKD